MDKMHLLFVCGRNQWRSPTAERIYRNDPRLEARSAGVSEKSPHRISAQDVQWADLILVMHRSYKTRIQEMFRTLALPQIENLDIPDEYRYMDPELVDVIKDRSESLIDKFLAARSEVA